MQNRSELDTLMLSRTFKLVNGQLRPDDEARIRAASLWHPMDLVNTVIDSKFDVLAFLGEGGMGAVYRARHKNLQKEVALKTLRADQISADSWQRFQREAQSIAKLRHPNIVQLFDFGISEQKLPYYTMELLDGESLADRLNRMTLISVDESLAIFIAVAAGMAHAHRQGIVHRDIKPGNIFIERGAKGGVPKVVDFGLAKLAESQSREEQSLTIAGVVFGSPLYMSPEQSVGILTDQRTDIYSFGCSLFQCLTGLPPFMGTNATEIMAMHQREKPPSLVQATRGTATFTIELEAIVRKLLAKDIEKRYQTFEEVESELTRALNSSLVQQSGAFATSGKQQVLPKKLEEEKLFPESLPSATSQSQSLEISEESPRTGLGRLAIFTVVILLLTGTGALFILNKKAEKHEITTTSKGAPAQEAMPEFFATATTGGGRLFNFPKDGKRLGDICWEGDHVLPARGKIFVPPGRLIHIWCGPLLSEHPELFSKFRQDDLNSLTLTPEHDWGREHFAEIGKLTGLKGLDISRSGAKTEDVASLKNLTELLDLSTAQTDLSGDDLAKLPVLQHLHILDAAETANIGPVLDQISGSPELLKLSLKGCYIDDTQIQKIAKIPNLKHLALDCNPFTIVGLRKLTALSKLTSLGMVGVKMDAETLEVLPKFKNLTRLRIQVSDWSQADIARLDRLMAGRHLERFGGLP
ncbi:MAG: protein kinase [Cyanobacteria bacterium SZAS TMP-1]|nr:protein kinase [Cyanobacteria bacterium SZAS TMP-1]